MSKLKSLIRKVKAKTPREKYLDYYQQLPIDENAVFAEARNGKEADGNIYYIVKELLTNPDYKNLKVYVSAESEELQSAFSRKLSFESGRETCFIVVDSDEYYRVAASAKYVISDATLKNFFMKKDGQVYLNVWHGTPFKVMGRRVAHEPHAIGNAQKNFVVADYLLYPSRYMMDHMVEDYMISGISEATALLGGYPRNAVFFDKDLAEEIRKTQSLSDKRVYVYMPTHRPELMGESLLSVLNEFDEQLSDNEVMFAKVHPLASDSVDYNNFTHIRPFPGLFETYEFLNIADCLITDYSSVFYDFAVTGKKIVLYTYDEEEYLKTRGLYDPMSSLPFDQVKTVADAVASARLPKSYDDTDFIEKYCTYESPTASADIVRKLISGKSYCQEMKIPSDNKPNIFVYAGSLTNKENIDMALNYLSDVDYQDENYFLVFNRGDVKDNFDFLLHMPEGSRYYGRAGRITRTGNSDLDYQLEWKRCFGNISVKDIVMLSEDTSSPLSQLMKWQAGRC